MAVSAGQPAASALVDRLRPSLAMPGADATVGGGTAINRTWSRPRPMTGT